MGINILHISVHLGGGVGTVINNWVKNDLENNHTVLLLNENYYGGAVSYVYDNMRNRNEKIKEWIEKSDLVIVHFWNHPFLFEFLVNFQFPPCRLCVWSHVSGLNPPYVHLEKLAYLTDRFILSSPISFLGDIKYFPNKLLNKISIIWTTGGVADYLKIDNKANESFIIGYIGTLDYSKISPNFVSLCEKVLKKIPDAKFVVCGTGPDEEKIKKEASGKKLDKSFDFKGICLNIKEIIPTFSVFGYPLNKKHFGTCEQVLGEVMAAGVIPVVFDNPAEKYIVGSVAKVSKNSEEYVKNIIDIYESPIENERVLLLKEWAKELYDINAMMASWNKLFSDVLKLKKRSRQWNKEKKIYDGYEIFLESIGKYADIIKSGDSDKVRNLFSSNNQWSSKSKGSVFQYIEAFPNDERLLALVPLAKQEEI